MELGLRQELVQKLSPQVMYSLKLLQYTTLELELELKQKLEENPLLEVIDEEGDEEEQGDNLNGESDDPEVKADPEDMELKSESKEIDWDEYLRFGAAYEHDYHEQHEKDEDQNLLDREGKSGTTLETHLSDQLHLFELSDRDRMIGEYIIGNLEEDGLLGIPLEEIAAVFSVEPAEVERVLKMVQTLEPVGVGARSLQECLLLQLQANGHEDSLASILIQSHWEDLQNRRLAVMKKALKIPMGEIQDAMEVIAGLNPKPGLSISDETAVPIIPDLVVEHIDGEYVVLLNDRNLPRLRISKLYHTILNRGSNASDDDRQYVRQKLADANWLVHSIEQRRTTMLKVMKYIVEAQSAFFDKGLPSLRPMILQNAADAIGIHPATVSRVTQGKFVQTPRGVFPLKYFFDGTIDTQDGQQLATKSVKDRIAHLIREEDSHAPLSDQKIVDILHAQGVDIARRTVAKYRDQLGIPTARMRKRV